MNIFEKIGIGVVLGVATILIVALVGIIAAIPTYFLWNWLMPEIFGLKAITFLQAWGIVFLTGILFKSASK
jgi:hypothetical protein